MYNKNLLIHHYLYSPDCPVNEKQHYIELIFNAYLFMMTYLPCYFYHLTYNKMTTRLTEFLILESARHTHFCHLVRTEDSL